jgi:uncharacterized membrane protein
MSQHHHDIFESRKQFQLERIILFSDAVFAIAITLLIIDIKVPELEGDVTKKMILDMFYSKLGELMGFVISFAVIGQFWTNHHRIFGYIKDYDGKLLWLNLLILFWVAVMPFSTHYIMQYGNLSIIWLAYSINLAFIGLSMYLMWRYISKHKHMCSMSHDVKFMQYYRQRAFSITLIFLLGGLIGLFDTVFFAWVSRLSFFLIFPVFYYLRKQYEKDIKKTVPHL